MLLVDLNYNFECDWFVELSDNNLAGELVGNRSFFNRSQLIVIFMINIYYIYKGKKEKKSKCYRQQGPT